MSSVESALFPINLPDLFLREITSSRRPHDGLLHSSSDLNGSLRHTQLRLAQAPRKQEPIASGIRLQHGQLWHEWFHQALVKSGVPFMYEVPLTKFMPPGWGGTADWVFWHPDYHAWILGDLKTTKGEAIYWINRNGAKEDHIWQLSSYYYALLAMGLPMVKGVGVMYWPMNNDYTAEAPVVPTLMEVDPLPEDVVLERMVERWAASQLYLETTDAAHGITPSQAKILMDVEGADLIDGFLNENIAPQQERVQKIVWNRLGSVFDLKLIPHWSAAFCDWDSPLCGCSLEGTTKVGHYLLDGSYVPRQGYEDVMPTVSPSPSDYKKRAPKEDNV